MAGMDETPKPHRRWPQFSLRMFFAVLTIFCLLWGWNVYIVRQRNELQNRQQRQIRELRDQVKELEKALDRLRKGRPFLIAFSLELRQTVPLPPGAKCSQSC